MEEIEDISKKSSTPLKKKGSEPATIWLGESELLPPHHFMKRLIIDVGVWKWLPLTGKSRGGMA